MGIARPGKASGVSVEAPAKINVCLKVIRKRPDGYHDLISVMTPVTLADRLEMEVRSKGGVELLCTGLPVPDGRENIAFRAAERFLAETGVREGVRVLLHKRVPTAAGLGGGSSDAAAVLLGMDAMWPGCLSDGIMKRLAVGLGADVPFFLSAVPAIARGIGEVLEPLANWPRMWYVLVKPPVDVSTAWVYGQVKIELTTRENDCIFHLLQRGGFSVPHILKNDLERVTEGAFPVIGRIKKALMESGAEGALMTGSGPTVFGVFRDRGRADAARRQLLPLDLGDVFLVTDWSDHGGPVRRRLAPLRE